MVPRVSRPGRSFTGAWAYYFHDKRSAEEIERGAGRHTAERVAWRHAENLGGIEDVRVAVGLMIGTARQSTRCEKPVYAFSLAWHPDEEAPDKAHMIEAARKALEALGMQEHQALMVAHTDTAHPHMHVIVNRIHPETGKAINLYKDREKLSAWALAYEQARGKLHCPARAFNALARRAALEQDGRPAPRRYTDNTIAECWSRSDSGRTFQKALEAKGWGLAKGDRKENVLMAVTPSGRAFAVLRELNKGLPKGQSINSADFDRQTQDLKRDSLPTVAQAQQDMQRRAKSRSTEKTRQQPALRPAWEKQRQAGAAKGAFDRAQQKTPQQAREGAATQAEQQGTEAKEQLEAWAQWQRSSRVRRHEAEADALWQKQQAESFTHRRALEQGYFPAYTTRMRALEAIEARQKAKGFKGWVERFKHRDDRENAPRLRREVEELTAQHEAQLTVMRQQHEAEAKALREQHGREKQEQERRIEQAIQAGRVPEPANEQEREKLQAVFQAYSRRQEEDRQRHERDRQESRDRGRGGRSRNREP
jgi:hypothetical protein